MCVYICMCTHVYKCVRTYTLTNKKPCNTPRTYIHIYVYTYTHIRKECIFALINVCGNMGAGEYI